MCFDGQRQLCMGRPAPNAAALVPWYNAHQAQHGTGLVTEYVGSRSAGVNKRILYYSFFRVPLSACAHSPGAQAGVGRGSAHGLFWQHSTGTRHLTHP